MIMIRHSVVARLAVWCMAAAAAAWAQQDGGGAPPSDSDPPTVAARLSYAEGALALQPAGADDWTAVPLNRPLTIGDQLWSDRGSRAEIEFPSAAVRLDADSDLELLSLSDTLVQLRVSVGTVDVTLGSLDPTAAFEVDAPNAAVALLEPGVYRISVDSTGETTVALRTGAAQVIGTTDQSITLRSGQGAVFGANGGFDVAPLSPPDDFDRWCQQRDARIARNEAATPYVAADAVGYEELNDYGAWQEDSDDGYVWYPADEPDDWAPYRTGQWLWIVPWGWTWVDAQPWGFAPFHYGRWSHRHGRWGWVPAAPRLRAVYAPALVAWIGGPSVGTLGWLALAPGEIYVPYGRVSERYALSVNITNTVVPNTSYVSRILQNPRLQTNYANGVSARTATFVAAGSFVSGQSITHHTVVPPIGWAQMTPVPRMPDVVPTRESVFGARLAGRSVHPPDAVVARRVLAKHAPAPQPPAFARQLDAMRANGGHPLAGADLARLRAPDVTRANVTIIHSTRGPPPPAAVSRTSTPSQPAIDLRIGPSNEAALPSPTAPASVPQEARTRARSTPPSAPYAPLPHPDTQRPFVAPQRAQELEHQAQEQQRHEELMHAQELQRQQDQQRQQELQRQSEPLHPTEPARQPYRPAPAERPTGPTEAKPAPKAPPSRSAPPAG